MNDFVAIVRVPLPQNLCESVFICGSDCGDWIHTRCSVFSDQSIALIPRNGSSTPPNPYTKRFR